MTDSNIAFECIVQNLDPHARLLRVWPLTGGVSAQVTAIEYERSNGEIGRAIVRQHGQIDRAQNPHIAADEFKLLQVLKAVGLTVPTPYVVDESGELLALPYVVVEYIDGVTNFTPANLPDSLHQLAAHLAQIHSVDTAAYDLSFLPHKVDFYTRKLAQQPAQLDTSLSEDRIRSTLEVAWSLPRKNASGLLHGDFWPGNILWKNGQLVGVIDWEDAGLGDPLIDLANSRLEVLWMFGDDAMIQFTDNYRAIIPNLDVSHLPYWDLCAALRPIASMATWTDDMTVQQRMRDRHALFVAQAFEQIDRLRGVS